MEARSSRPRADPQDLGDLGEGQPGVEMEDDHRSVRRGEHGECPLQRVPIGERTRGIIDPGLQVEEMHLAGVSPSTIGLGVATQDQDPVEPLVEASRVTETGQAAPAADHRLLEGILRGIWIAEDLASDREQVIANRTDERLERVGSPDRARSTSSKRVPPIDAGAESSASAPTSQAIATANR